MKLFRTITSLLGKKNFFWQIQPALLFIALDQNEIKPTARRKLGQILHQLHSI